MYKPFLIYLLFSLFFISGLILVKPQLAYADISLISPSSTISLTHDQIYKEFYSIPIKIYSPDRAFDTSTPFIVYVWNNKMNGPIKDSSGNCYRQRLYSLDGKNIDTLVILRNCASGTDISGQWNIQLSYDKNIKEVEPPLVTFSFIVGRSSGDLRIEAKNGKTTVGPNENVEVNLINPEIGKSYTFWWVSSWRKNTLFYPEVGAVIKPGNATDIPPIPKTIYSSSFSLTPTNILPDDKTKQTLCVENTRFDINTLNLNRVCDDPAWSIDFTFSLKDQNPPSGGTTTVNPVCTLTPSQPKLGDILSMDISGLTPSTDYRIVIIETNTNTGGTKDVRSGTDGKIPNYILFTKTPTGNYKIEVIDVVNNKSMCAPINFSVGTPPATINKAKGVPTPCGTKGVATAIGCIETTPTDLIKNIFTFFVGVSGGIAFLTMVYGGFKMMVSRGEPQALANAKQLFTSAIIGLLFVVFAILLLQIIGADILAIPGFKS